jgi:DnaJ-class molecular chaperone
MKKCPDCDGCGMEVVTLPNGAEENDYCQTCQGLGVIIETDQEADSARQSRIAYECH